MKQMMILVEFCGTKEGVYKNRHTYFWTFELDKNSMEKL